MPSFTGGHFLWYKYVSFCRPWPALQSQKQQAGGVMHWLKIFVAVLSALGFVSRIFGYRAGWIDRLCLASSVAGILLAAVLYKRSVYAEDSVAYMHTDVASQVVALGCWIALACVPALALWVGDITSRLISK